MTEIIYLSDRKLRQVLFGERQRASLSGATLEIEATLLAKLRFVLQRSPDVAKSHQKMRQLEKAISTIEMSQRSSKWFSDDSVQAGDWITFDNAVRMTLPSDERLASAVVFASTPEYYEDASRHMLLHGDRSHMVGYEADDDTRPLLEGVSIDSTPHFLRKLETDTTHWHHFLSSVGRLWRTTAESVWNVNAPWRRQYVDGKVLPSEIPNAAALGADDQYRVVEEVIDEAEDLNPPELKGKIYPRPKKDYFYHYYPGLYWGHIVDAYLNFANGGANMHVAGIARVTEVIDLTSPWSDRVISGRLITASPLYVEMAPPIQNMG